MTVSILGQRYTLKYETNETMEGDMGACMPRKMWIKINKTIAKVQQEETLIHEVLHCISDELLLGLDEGTIQRIAAGMHSCGCKVRVDK
jgi:hypothetical protein